MEGYLIVRGRDHTLLLLGTFARRSEIIAHPPICVGIHLQGVKQKKKVQLVLYLWRDICFFFINCLRGEENMSKFYINGRDEWSISKQTKNYMEKNAC